MRTKSIASRRHASGSTLLIAVVLLLLAGILAVLAMNVGLFEQRSTANDVRAKSVHEVAEAGLAQGAEYLLRQQSDMLTFGTATWEPCPPTDTSFPCGSVGTDLVDIDGEPGGGTIARRATMYRLANSGASIPGLASLQSRMLNLPAASKIATVGSGFPVAYGVGPVMCFVAKKHPEEPKDSPIRCATDASQASERRIVTFVSVASMVGENARTTLTQTVGRYPLIEAPLGKPPIVASGSVNVTGGLQLVVNPNAGGTGVPVSVWSRTNVEKTGTPNTCYADEFFRFGAQNNAPPTFEGTTVKTIVCDTCQCAGNESLSYDSSGNVQDEGIDILDVEGDSTQRGTGVNYNVRSDSESYKLGICEFPPDLFAHLLGVQAWADNDKDCFAETKIMREFTNPNTGAVVVIGADEAFLYENAVKVINATTAGAGLRSPSQNYSGAYPDAGLSGLIWCQSNCDIGSNKTLGSVDKPVILVADGPVQIQGRVFGVILLRSTANGATLTPSGGYTMSAAEIANGGNSTLQMNAGAAVYGSIVVQGLVTKANGTAAVIYSEAVLSNIGKSADNPRFATLPGAWNERTTY